MFVVAGAIAQPRAGSAPTATIDTNAVATDPTTTDRLAGSTAAATDTWKTERTAAAASTRPKPQSGSKPGGPRSAAVALSAFVTAATDAPGPIASMTSAATPAT